MANAIYANGIVVTYEDDTPTAQTIGKIVGFTGFDGEAADIDITTFASSAKEFCQGLQDFGNISFEVIRDYDDVGQAALLDALNDQEAREMVITLPSGTLNTITLQAYVKSFSSDASNSDDVVRGTVNLKITGLPVISTV